ncbi:MAG: hemolysin D [Planctomycetaceae bacterium]
MSVPASSLSRPLSPSRRWLWSLPLFVVALLGGLALLRWRAQTVARVEAPPQGPGSLAGPGEFSNRRVHALGRLEPRGEVVRLAPPAGNDGARVETLLVAEGDEIPPQTLVARLDTYARKAAELTEAEARLLAAQARLAQPKAGAKPGDIEAQQAAVDLLAEQINVSRRDLERAERFRNQKVISGEDFDKYQWALDKTTLEFRRARQLLDAIREVRETDVRVQETEVATAEAAVAAAKERVEAAEVRNPTAGRILKIHTRPGEKVGDNGLLELGDVSQMQAVAEVFEGDVGLLVPGQGATISVDGTRDELRGTIVELGNIVARKVVLTNDPVSDTDARVVEVRVQLEPQSSRRVERLSNARVEVTFDPLPEHAASPASPKSAGADRGPG